MKHNIAAYGICLSQPNFKISIRGRKTWDIVTGYQDGRGFASLFNHTQSKHKDLYIAQSKTMRHFDKLNWSNEYRHEFYFVDYKNNILKSCNTNERHFATCTILFISAFS